MLYVDAANTAAVDLYRSLGFKEDHTDRAYSRVVAPVTPA
jgi:ribosomal protein S18 acetylase RimI-like enzyme